MTLHNQLHFLICSNWIRFDCENATGSGSCTSFELVRASGRILNKLDKTRHKDGRRADVL